MIDCPMQIIYPSEIHKFTEYISTHTKWRPCNFVNMKWERERAKETFYFIFPSKTSTPFAFKCIDEKQPFNFKKPKSRRKNFADKFNFLLKRSTSFCCCCYCCCCSVEAFFNKRFSYQICEMRICRQIKKEMKLNFIIYQRDRNWFSTFWRVDFFLHLFTVAQIDDHSGARKCQIM